jgi:hypothetical protein
MLSFHFTNEKFLLMLKELKPESSRENNFQAEIKKAQDETAKELLTRFELYKDVPYKFYDDSPGRNGNAGEIEGYPRYYVFLKEADYLAQYALSKESDVLLVADTSARGYGLLVNKILPVVALEKAVRERKKPSEIKTPKVLFYRPVFHGGVTLGGERGFSKVEDRARYIKSLNVQNVLIFDEGSDDGPDAPTLVQPDGSEPYRWKEAELEASGQTDVNTRGRTFPTFKENVSLKLEIERLKALLPGVNLSGYLGGYQAATGFDGVLRKDSRIPFGLEFNIGHPKESSHEIFSKRFGKTEYSGQVIARTEARLSNQKFRETGLGGASRAEAQKQLADIENESPNLRQQFRDEQSRMAWELFQQIILRKDPYHAQVESK